MKYANYVRTSRYLAGPILSALALAACAIDTGTPPTPEDAESETSTREAAIEEATDAPSNTGWEAPSPIIHRQKISPAAHAAWVERAKSRRAASRRDRSQPGASATPGLAPISGEAPEGASVASMVVQLAEPGFAFERFRGRTPEERPPIVAERRAQLEAQNAAVIAKLEALGGHVVSRFWISNSLVLEVPVENLPALQRVPGVLSLRHQVLDTQEPTTFDGTHVRNGVQARALVDQEIRGSNGNKGTSDGDIRIAISEQKTAESSGLVRSTHVAFKDSAAGSSRVKKRYSCTDSCVEAATAEAPGGHATLVAAATAGSLEQNQDPNFLDASADYPGNASQIGRSGVAPEALLYSYATSGNGYIQSIEQAITDGVDIFNRSAGSKNQECEDQDTLTFGDDGGGNDALRNAASAGLLLIHSSGNGHAAADTCTVTWPGWRPEVISVGGLETTAEATAYGSLEMWAGSGRGFALTDQGPTGHPIVALTAPAEVTGLASSEADNAYFGSKSGTSISAPIVSGAAALLKHALYDNGAFSATVQDGRRMLVNLLLMGDGWKVPDLGNTGAEEETASGVSPTSGYGRIRLNTPQTLTAPWKWSSGVPRLGDGERTWWSVGGTETNGNAKPLPASVTQLKWALAWYPGSLNNTGDIDAEIWTASCSTADPRTGTKVVSDTSSSFRKRLQASGSAVAGKCTFMVINAHETSDGSEPVYSAYYYHAGDPSTH